MCAHKCQIDTHAIYALGILHKHVSENLHLLRMGNQLSSPTCTAGRPTNSLPPPSDVSKILHGTHAIGIQQLIDKYRI